MLSPAGLLEKIVSGKDYIEDSIRNNKTTIFSIHCLETNKCEVEITTQGDTKVDFPPGSLIQGAVYHIFIRVMKFDENKASFIGYRLLPKNN